MTVDPFVAQYPGPCGDCRLVQASCVEAVVFKENRFPTIATLGHAVRETGYHLANRELS